MCGAEQRAVFLVILVQKSIPNDGAAPAKKALIATLQPERQSWADCQLNEGCGLPIRYSGITGTYLFLQAKKPASCLQHYLSTIDDDELPSDEVRFF